MTLSNEYRLVYEENKVVTLQFFESRIRKKKDGNTEAYEFTDNYYYPNLKKALKAFVNKSVMPSKNIEEVLDKIKSLESKIDKITIKNN
ncbi:hypothetical protein N9014_00200 [bacterium]|nr:hypothetical protein [bacterium]|tara:strand:- start:82 stop:348 length:267 start_codon:yes stop_codon:yes gene_type:complete